MGQPYRGPTNPDPKPGESGIIVYGYLPAFGPPITAIVLFGVLVLLHVYHLARYGRATRVFQGLIILGCVMEICGYCGRLASHYHPFVVNFFILNYFMIVCAPIAFSAALYLALGDIVKKMPTDRKYTPLSPRALVATFVAADIATIVTQISGASLVGVADVAQANGHKIPVTPDQANNILLAGLAVQSCSFAIFLTIYAAFLFRLRGASARPPMALLVTLGVSALLIFLRTLFRLSETAQGLLGFLMVHEEYFVGLELAPVVIAIALWAGVPLGAGLLAMEDVITPTVGEPEVSEVRRNAGLY